MYRSLSYSLPFCYSKYCFRCAQSSGSSCFCTKLDLLTNSLVIRRFQRHGTVYQRGSLIHLNQQHLHQWLVQGKAKTLLKAVICFDYGSNSGKGILVAFSFLCFVLFFFFWLAYETSLNIDTKCQHQCRSLELLGVLFIP